MVTVSPGHRYIALLEFINMKMRSITSLREWVGVSINFSTHLTIVYLLIEIAF